MSPRTRTSIIADGFRDDASTPHIGARLREPADELVPPLDQFALREWLTGLPREETRRSHVDIAELQVERSMTCRAMNRDRKSVV